MLTRPYRFAFLLLLLTFVAGVGIAFTAELRGSPALYLTPTLASIVSIP